MDAPTSTRSEPPPEGSLAYARALETRMAKLERMLAHRMAENDELRARVAVLEGGERVESAHRRELSFAEVWGTEKRVAGMVCGDDHDMCCRCC